LCLALGGSAALSTAVATAHPQAAHPHDTAAPVARSFYIQGPYFNGAGYPVTLAGVASVNVDSTGSYSGTLVTIGTQPATLTVTGTVTQDNMSLYTTLNGAALTITARGVVDNVYDRGKANTLPATTLGLEYQGDISANGATAGYVTAIDTSIMREYSFSATVNKGPSNGTAINASLFLLLDRYGGLHGYMKQDITGYLFPLQSGTLNRGRMLVHIDLVGGGQIIGVANQSSSAIPGQTAYQGTFGGPKALDSGTWLSAPPEQ
jgi:hypothetical protein